MKKYTDEEIKEFKHFYWQSSKIFHDENLYDKISDKRERNGFYTPFGMTKNLLGLSDSTLRRCIFIYGTDRHEKYKEKERERTRKKRERFDKTKTVGKKSEQNSFAARIGNFKRNGELKEFYMENKDKTFCVNRGLAKTLIELGTEGSLTKIIKYIKKNPEAKLDEIYNNFGVKGLNNTRYLSNLGYFKRV